MELVEMILDATRIREEREKRAWTQEQLAEIAGLGVRTVQRIEATGVASFESAASLSSALAIPLSELRLERAIGMPKRARRVFAKRGASTYVWFLLTSLIVAAILSPPRLAVLVAMWLSLWFAFEIGVAVASRRRPS